jgi:serine/threonine-protein kinase
MTTPTQLAAALSNRYAIERKIGEGGMATVYLARDLRHARRVALKVLKPELGAVLGADRFLGEIRVTANLQHPNLLPLFDSGEANGMLFYVMPFVEGESLRDRLEREKQLPIEEAIRIAVAVSGALDYAHRHGVIHRDLKPENILLHDGQPVVADFGIALAVSNAGGGRITQTGLSLGTPQYMSPEQATGDRVIDGRADIYSLGAVTYEMLTGEPPHWGTTAQAIIAKLLTDEPRPVTALRRTVPEYVDSAIRCALEKLPADRWGTAREFGDALQGKASATTTYRAPIARRHALPLALMAVAAVAVAFSVWTLTRQQPEESRPAVRFTIASSVPGEMILPFTPAISPDGRLVAYAIRDTTGSQKIAVRDIRDLTLRYIDVTAGAYTPFFSPDGVWLAFAKNGGGLYKVPVAGGPAMTVLDAVYTPGNTQGASWVRGDSIVFAVRDTLFVVSADGGKARPLGHPVGGPAAERGQAAPRALDDLTTVLYQSWRTSPIDSHIGVASLATGDARVLDVAGYPVGMVDGYLIYGTVTGSLFAAPFDVSKRRITGRSVQLAEQVDVGLQLRAVVSRSGSLVYATRRGSAEVVLADMHGVARPLVDQQRRYANPRFSPDGRRLAVDISSNEGTDVWIYDLASKTLTKLTNEGAVNQRPEWSPDGKRVLFQSNRRGRNELWIQNADLSGKAELLEAEPNGNVNSGEFSADGKYLVFWLTSPTHRVDILYRQLAGDTTRKDIAATPAAEVAPKLSAEGRWIAYASNQDGSLQVYAQPFPPTGVRYQVTAGGGTAPVWSRDGRKIYYVLGNRLMAATIRTSPAFQVTAREPMFQGNYQVSNPPHANYDISPDGKEFVLLRSTGADDQLVVVHDFKYELRERMRAASSSTR